MLAIDRDCQSEQWDDFLIPGIGGILSWIIRKSWFLAATGLFYMKIKDGRISLNSHWPKIWMILSPTLSMKWPPLPGPRHSISVPFRAWVAVRLSTDENEVAFVPNPGSGTATKWLPGPQVEEVVLPCNRTHVSRLLPPTLQMVFPVLSPPTIHLKVMVSPGQVGGDAVNCPATLSADNQLSYNYHKACMSQI